MFECPEFRISPNFRISEFPPNFPQVDFVDEVGDGVAGLVAEVDGGEAVEGQVDGFGLRMVQAGELLHGGVAAIGAEGGFAAHPVGIFFGDGALGELVFEADFEFGAVEAAFALEFGDVEFAVFFADFVGYFFGDEGGGGEDELELVDGFEFGFEGFEGVDGEAGGGDAEFGAGLDGLFEVVAEEAVDVVEDLQRVSLARLG